MQVFVTPLFLNVSSNRRTDDKLGRFALEHSQHQGTGTDEGNLAKTKDLESNSGVLAVTTGGRAGSSGGSGGGVGDGDDGSGEAGSFSSGIGDVGPVVPGTVNAVLVNAPVEGSDHLGELELEAEILIHVIGDVAVRPGDGADGRVDGAGGGDDGDGERDHVDGGVPGVGGAGLDRGDVLGDLDDDEVGGVAVAAVGNAEVGLEVGARDTDGGVGSNVGLDVGGGQEESRDDGGGNSEELHCWLCVDVRGELVGRR